MEEWTKAIQLHQSKEVVDTYITNVRGPGLSVSIGQLSGFVPYRFCDPGRLAEAERASAATPEDVAIASCAVTADRDEAVGARLRVYGRLKGQKIRVKVMQVIVPQQRLICSEKAALLDELSLQVQRGDVIEGVVGTIFNFGALINVATVNGEAAPAALVCLPIRELSWDWVGEVSEVVQCGQTVRCVVVNLTPPPHSAVLVSLKRMQKDPLAESFPDDSYDNQQLSSSGLGEVPKAIEEFLDALRQEPNITNVTPGRRGLENYDASEDLEVWMSKENVPGGYAMVSRAGREMQEIVVSTDMSSRDMKAAVQRVLHSLA